jgi:hypothetical protein
MAGVEVDVGVAQCLHVRHDGKKLLEAIEILRLKRQENGRITKLRFERVNHGTSEQLCFNDQTTFQPA